MTKNNSSNNLPTWQNFGSDLLTSYDLDPIYPMVAGAGLDVDVMQRWCLAYWCYYHAGVCCAIAELPSDSFYDAIEQGIDENWPRGMERRYFYGKIARETLAGLRDFGSPERVVEYMTRHKDCQTIFHYVQKFVGFGPWISWKIADMTDRVLGWFVDFSEANLMMYRDPVKGAAYILTGDKDYPITGPELNGVVDMMLKYYHGYFAPPYQDRVVNIQEIETILCKYKAHCFGHYPWGNDTIHVARALDGWGDMANHMSKVLRRYTTYETQHR